MKYIIYLMLVAFIGCDTVKHEMKVGETWENTGRLNPFDTARVKVLSVEKGYVLYKTSNSTSSAHISLFSRWECVNNCN